MTINNIKILVDITPILPGGTNGGAKTFVINLLKNLSKISPEIDFVLLTRRDANNELKTLDSLNMSRQIMIEDTNTYLISKFMEVLPKKFLNIIANKFTLIFLNIFKKNYTVIDIKKLNANLLFCPFTSPIYAIKGIPTVSIVYDLQYLTYPNFFGNLELVHRDLTIKEAFHNSDYLVAISEYTRKSILKYNKNIDIDKIKVILIQIDSRENKTEVHDNIKNEVLDKYNLLGRNYIIYPANFWKHKNHEMLITAFNIAMNKYKNLNIKLLLTGDFLERKELLQSIVDRMGLANKVIFTGYLNKFELDILLSKSLALIFPSLYEGFGIPLVEAMDYNIPITCSDKTSIPEIVGNAAIYFDPRIPEEMADSISSIILDNKIREKLIENNKKIKLKYLNPVSMAFEYKKLFMTCLKK